MQICGSVEEISTTVTAQTEGQGVRKMQADSEQAGGASAGDAVRFVEQPIQ